MNTEFTSLLNASFQEQKLIKITLSDKKDKQQDLQKVLIKPVMLKKGFHLSFVYRYPTKDVTKNYLPDEALAEIIKLMDEQLQQALLFTTKEDAHYTTSGKAKLTVKKPSFLTGATLSHDKEKTRLITPQNNPYLFKLGVTNKDGKVKKDMQDKYRQINKYIEIVDGALHDIKTQKALTVIDMGAGKGYLSFALYDYMQHTLKIDTKMIGVELRDQLVKDTNLIAQEIDYKGFEFITGEIAKVTLPPVDVLIALHACNTATDDAIYRGIKADAKLIICSPCCHKQIRHEIAKENALSAITRFGILKERQAEIVTDAIRALYLEAYGYKTQVFEFIATEHTPKNIIITASKPEKGLVFNADKLKEAEQLRQLLGIEKHYLDTLDWNF